MPTHDSAQLTEAELRAMRELANDPECQQPLDAGAGHHPFDDEEDDGPSSEEHSGNTEDQPAKTEVEKKKKKGPKKLTRQQKRARERQDVMLTDEYTGEYRRVDLNNLNIANVEDINKYCAIVLDDSKCTVIFLDDLSRGRKMCLPTRYDFHTFCQVMAVYTTYDAKSDKEIPLAPLWLKWPGRRIYTGFVCEPGVEDTGTMLNVGTEPPVDPAGDEDGCDLFLDHIWANVVKQNDYHYRWLMTWFADGWQNPRNKPGTSVVMIGDHGVGKSKVGELYADLFGWASYICAGGGSVVGRFNAHWAGARFILIDEYRSRGNNAEHDAFKHVITATKLAVEAKGKNVVMLNNYSRVMVTTNRREAVHVEDGDRRFYIVEMNDNRVWSEGEQRLKPNKAYFKAMTEQWENGGREAFANVLDKWCPVRDGGFEDGWDVLRDAPMTEEKVEQAALAHTTLDMVMEDLLFDELVEDDGKSVVVEDHQGTTFIRQKALHDFIKNSFMNGTQARYVFKKMPGLKERRRALEKWFGIRINTRDDTPSIWVGHEKLRAVVIDQPLGVLRQRAVERLGSDPARIEDNVIPIKGHPVAENIEAAARRDSSRKGGV